jgi:hypothetical protein
MLSIEMMCGRSTIIKLVSSEDFSPLLINRQDCKSLFNQNLGRCSKPIPQKECGMGWVHLALANMCVGAKHDRSEYGMITNNLSAVMLRPLQKPDAPDGL